MQTFTNTYLFRQSAKKTRRKTLTLYDIILPNDNIGVSIITRARVKEPQGVR